MKRLKNIPGFVSGSGLHDVQAIIERPPCRRMLFEGSYPVLIALPRTRFHIYLSGSWVVKLRLEFLSEGGGGRFRFRIPNLHDGGICLGDGVVKVKGFWPATRVERTLDRFYCSSFTERFHDRWKNLSRESNWRELLERSFFDSRIE